MTPSSDLSVTMRLLLLFTIRISTTDAFQIPRLRFSGSIPSTECRIGGPLPLGSSRPDVTEDPAETTRPFRMSSPPPHSDEETMLPAQSVARRQFHKRQNRDFWTAPERKHDERLSLQAKTVRKISRNRVPRSLPGLRDLLGEYNRSVGGADKTAKARAGAKGSSRSFDATTDWNAGPVDSSMTQARIKAAVALSRKQNKNGRESAAVQDLRVAIHILDVLSNTDVKLCNEMNLIYVLSQSAKLYPSHPSSHATDIDDEEGTLRRVFIEKLTPLLEILEICLKRDNASLTGRQLSNAAWALSKHSRQLKPTSRRQNEDDISLEARIRNLLRDVSVPLSNRVREGRPNTAELSMASWAYSVVHPRDTPVGWKFSAQESRLPRATDHGSGGNGNEGEGVAQDVVTFERGEGIYFSATQTGSSKDDDDDGAKSRNKKQGQQLSGGGVDVEGDDMHVSILDSIAEALLKKGGTPRTSPGVKSTSSSTQLSPSNADSNKYISTNLLQCCSWKELSNLAWSYANAGHDTSTSQRLFLALAEETVRRLKYATNSTHTDNHNTPSPRDLSTVVWSLGIMQVSNYRLSDSTVAVVDALWEFLTLSKPSADPPRRPFADWKCADLVQLAVSLAHCRMDHSDLLPELYGEAARKIESSLQRTRGGTGEMFQSWELTVLLWAQAKLYLTDGQSDEYGNFTRLACQSLLDRTDAHDPYRQSLGPQEQANLAWSLTVLEHYTPASTAVLQNIYRASSAESVIKLEHAHQLWQALFILKQDHPAAVSQISPRFESFLETKWFQEKSRSKTSSARHLALSKTLHLMGVAHYNEHHEDIDVAIVLKDASCSWTHKTESLQSDTKGRTPRGPKKTEDAGRCTNVAVEFDGPGHFTREPLKGRPRALGHTVMKYRFLKIQGWTVVRVPYYEFDKIPFWASMERQRYLQRVLKTHANIRFSGVDVSEYKAIVHNRKSRFD